MFDDTNICQQDKKTDSKKNIQLSNTLSDTEQQWLVYPNPAKQQIWITGQQMDKLQNIQLFNSIGELLLQQQATEEVRLEIKLPAKLQAGIYFLHLQLLNGDRQTHKILLQP